MPDLVGTWRPVGVISHDPDGKPLAPPYRSHPIGRIEFNTKGRIVVAVSDGRRELPASAKHEYEGYTGAFTFDGSTLTTHFTGSGSNAGSKGWLTAGRSRFLGALTTGACAGAGERNPARPALTRPPTAYAQAAPPRHARPRQGGAIFPVNAAPAALRRLGLHGPQRSAQPPQRAGGPLQHRPVWPQALGASSLGLHARAAARPALHPWRDQCARPSSAGRAWRPERQPGRVQPAHGLRFRWPEQPQPAVDGCWSGRRLVRRGSLPYRGPARGAAPSPARRHPSRSAAGAASLRQSAPAAAPASRSAQLPGDGVVAR